MVAQFAIPGTSPGGMFGCTANKAIYVCVLTSKHSDFFLTENLRAQIVDGGLWHNFLTHPLEHFTPKRRLVPASWRRAACISAGTALPRILTLRSTCFVLTAAV
ncbi:hypothetical protein SAMN05216452_2230 [Nitratireductor aquibiodomus]|jgi:hypothetical protein|uniref:Uncharacterized protein n=1 Tax=Nitratireductor aquibiodomus TaxID=204799 RepID=A0A1H4KG69_9HYPH|nr:hypothetical protein SAMN05216452_2230 [Nitratireductor aquibiodomus]